MTGRYAMVTPYYKEGEALLRRCIDSVRAQSVPCDHLMIADGFPQAWIDDAPVRHLKLDRAHADYGNTPRGLGALLAAAEEYDGIGLLDADNWIDRDHVEVCLAAAASCEGGAAFCDYVIARRRLCRPDETVMPIRQDPGLVDTNCFFFLRGAFAVLSRWATMPKPMAPLCDRVFLGMLRQQPLRHASTAKVTVNYHCLWESCYRILGEEPPAGAKPNIDADMIDAWLGTLSAREREIAYRLAGLSAIPRATAEQVFASSRNALCSCGSGKRFKNCHGALT
jgi:SEC-C motif